MSGSNGNGDRTSPPAPRSGAPAPLAALNDASLPDAREILARCCGATRWIERVAATRPFRNGHDLLEAGDAAFEGLERDDWLEAFRAHPRIGERHAARSQTATEARWSASEQAGTTTAGDATRAALAAGNAAYEARFGFLYLVCAAGKSADELRARLEARLHNDRATELAVAADEQRQIMRLRLDRLLLG